MLHKCKVEVAKTGTARGFAVRRGGARRIGQQTGAIHEQKRPVADAYVARISEQRQQFFDESPLVLDRIGLRDQQLVIATVPAPRTLLVGPADTERKVRLAARGDLVERAVQQSRAVEPVVVVAEAMNAMRTRQLGLRCARLGCAQVVEPQLAGQMRLVNAPA